MGMGIGVGMKIELSKEKIKRMKAIMGKDGFKAWIEAMKRAGNEVVIDEG